MMNVLLTILTIYLVCGILLNLIIIFGITLAEKETKVVMKTMPLVMLIIFYMITWPRVVFHMFSKKNRNRTRSEQLQFIKEFTEEINEAVDNPK